MISKIDTTTPMMRLIKIPMEIIVSFVSNTMNQVKQKNVSNQIEKMPHKRAMFSVVFGYFNIIYVCVRTRNEICLKKFFGFTILNYDSSRY